MTSSEISSCPATDRPRLRCHLLVALLLVAVGTAVYSRSLDGPFVYDDRINLVGNRGLHQPSSLGEILASGHQETRPLTLLSFALCFAASSDPASAAPVFRAVNLLLHLAVALLVYLLGLRIRADLQQRAASDGDVPCDGQGAQGAGWFPAAAALLFVAHPVATEGVAYINARSGLLAALFGLASLLLYLACDTDRETGGARRGRALASYAGSLLCLLAALLSKESAAITPLLVLVYLVLLRRPGGRPLRRALPLAGHLLLTVAAMWLVLSLARFPHGSSFGLALFGWADYALTQVRVHAFALLLLALPLQQNFDYDFRVSQGPFETELAAAAVLLGALGWLAWRSRGRAPLFLFGLLWFAVALAPTNSLVQFKDLLAERHLYLPLVGLCLALAWGLGQWAARLRAATGSRLLSHVPLVAGLGLIGGFALLASARASLIADPLRLWRDTVQRSPHKARPRLNHAIALLERGHLEQGHRELQRALQLDPDQHQVHYNLGVFFERRGQLQAALRHLRRANALDPKRQAYRAALARAANRLGVTAMRAGQLDAATEALEQAIAARPDHAGAHFNLALARALRGDRERARELLHRTLQLDPGHRKARAWLDRLRLAADGR